MKCTLYLSKLLFVSKSIPMISDKVMNILDSRKNQEAALGTQT